MPVPLGAIVLVAHGPSDLTVAAAERAAAIVAGGRVVVVAGTEPGEPAVRAAARAGYQSHAEHGPAAVAAAVLGCDPGPVMVVHDDLVVGPVGAEALLLAHLAAGRTAIPLSAAVGAEVEGAFGGRASLACSVGERDAMAELALHGGFAPGLVRRGEWTTVAASTVDHGGTCAQRLLGDRAPDGRPLLVAAMIVRDEAGFLPGCLESLAPVVDRVEIADTGSTDHTVALAEAAGATVRSITWRNDFAWARNQVLARCGDAHYILWIDADERLVCPDPVRLRRQLATYRSTYDAFRLEIRNRDGNEVTSTFRAKRIVRTTGVQFVGALHEQPRPLDREAPWREADLKACAIDHLGYATTVMTGRDKLARNLELASADWRQRGDTASLLHYLRTLAVAGGEPAEIVGLLDAAATDIAAAPAPIQAYLLGLRGLQERALGDAPAALRSARAALALVPADEVAQGLLADLLLTAGRHRELLTELAASRGEASAEPAFRDRVARANRNHAIVQAAAATGDWDAALGALEELPKGFDPWTVLLTAAAAEHEVIAAFAAGAAHRGDGTFDAAAAYILDDTGRRRAHGAWLGAGGSVDEIAALDDAVAVADAVAAAEALYHAYERWPGQDAAVVYARAAVAGAPDLAAEVARAGRTEAAGADEHAAAVALGAAAAAHERRGDHARAKRDAEAAVAIWPAAPRAVAVLGRAFAGTDDAAVVELVEQARRAGVDMAATRAQLVEIAEVALAARAASGDFLGSVDEALTLFESDQPLPWVPLLEAAGEDVEHQSVLVRLALVGDGGRFVEAAARTLRPETTAELCAAFLMSGGTAPTAVSTGLTAALMRGRADLVELLIEHHGLLSAEVSAVLATKLRQRGMAAAAARLDGSLV